MSNDIKAGDLVMVVKPTKCCGRSSSVGQIFVAGPVAFKSGICACGAYIGELSTFDKGDGNYCQVERLIKIDPPAEGDSLPTRANLDQPVELA